MNSGTGSGKAAGGPEHRYACFGLEIQSEIALPELADLPAPASAGAHPPVFIRYGTIAPTPPGVARVRLTGDETLLIDSTKTARYLVRGGAEIVVDPYAGGSPRQVRLLLLGSAFGVLCHQRGLMPLHANAVVVDGTAVAFAGRAGIGKSTLAAYFQARGYPVLCDDVCVVSFDEQGRPLAWPGLPRLKLWRDAAETFGHDSRTLERAIEGHDKFHVPLSPAVGRGPYALARVYVLRNLPEGADAAIARLPASAAVRVLMENTYRRSFLQRMNLINGNFLQATAVAHHAAVFRAPRHRGFDVFDREAARLEDHLHQPDATASGGGRALSA